MEGNPSVVPLTVPSSSLSPLLASKSLTTSTVSVSSSRATVPSSNALPACSSATVAADHVTPKTTHIGGKPKSFMAISLSGSEGKKGSSKKTSKSTPSRGHGSKVGKSGDGAAPTRSSQRQIKRPKTDEELVNCEASSRGSTTSKKIKTSTSSIKGSGVSQVKCHAPTKNYCQSLISLPHVHELYKGIESWWTEKAFKVKGVLISSCLCQLGRIAWFLFSSRQLPKTLDGGGLPMTSC